MNAELLTPERRRLLLSEHTSRCNKMHLACAWGVEWKWLGDGPAKSGEMTSRMAFLIDGTWQKARSWDEDVRPKLKDTES